MAKRESKNIRQSGKPRVRRSERPAGQADSVQLLRAAVFHEAGHIVAAKLLGLKIHFAIVELMPGDDGLGMHGYTELLLADVQNYGSAEAAVAAAQTPEMLRKRSIQALAGPMAESIATGNPLAMTTEPGGDWDRACQFALLATEPDADCADEVPNKVNAYLRECGQECQSLLMAHPAAVQAVANHLFAHISNRVDGAALETLANE